MYINEVFIFIIFQIFQCADEHCEKLVTALKDVIERFLSSNRIPHTLKLEKYISPNYMGLFLNDVQTEIFKNVNLQFIQEISNLGKYCRFF